MLISASPTAPKLPPMRGLLEYQRQKKITTTMKIKLVQVLEIEIEHET